MNFSITKDDVNNDTHIDVDVEKINTPEVPEVSKIPTYLTEIKDKFGVELDEDTITNIPNYKTAFEEYSNLKPILEDEEFKQILDFKKNGGTVSDFISASQIDLSKYTDVDLIKLHIREDLESKGYTKDLDTIVESTYRINFEKKSKNIDNRLSEINSELEFGEDENLIEERDNLILEKLNIENTITNNINAQKQKLEQKKVELLTPKAKEQPENIEEKIDSFRQDYTKQLENLDTKLNLLDGKFQFELDKKELTSVSEHILLQESMEDGKTPFVYLQGIDSKEVAKALYVSKNLDTIVSKAVAQKELEMDSLYNNKHIPNLKNVHYDNGNSKVEIIG
jgi:hypothetical protein